MAKRVADGQGSGGVNRRAEETRPGRANRRESVESRARQDRMIERRESWRYLESMEATRLKPVR
jgi:hypothetical protein